MKKNFHWMERKTREKGRNPNPNENLVKGRKKYLSKIKCFHCHEFGHYSMRCLHKKASNKALGGGAGEALASNFNLDFTFIACMPNTVIGSMWYLELGTLFHMTWNRDFFSDMEEKYLQMHIKMWNDGRYSMTKIGIVTFHRKLGSPLRLKNVMFIPGLKKNIIFVVFLEESVIM